MLANDRPTDKPVALLARPGAARERLKEALLAAGGQLVLEDDPNTLDVAALQASSASVVLVALEPAVEDALERLEPVLQAPHLSLVFDEAELAGRREGWEAQRWVRHLAAKLHGHDNVLPPGQEQDATPLPEPGMPERPAERHADAPLQFHLDEAVEHADEVPVDGLYVPPAEPESGVLSFEELMAMAPRAPLDEVSAAPVAPATPPALPPPLPAVDAVADVQPATPTASPAPAVEPGSFANWSLLDDDAYVAPVAEAVPVAASTTAFLPDSGLELEPVTEAGAGAANPVQGAVLLLAGIGGPDAVRRLLGGLPQDFPHPVLVQMRLDGGRYANLVKQMARVSALPVLLADAGHAAEAGTVHILSDDMGLEAAAGALRFAAEGATLLPVLPLPHSAVVMLSGADPSLVPAVLDFAAQGGWVAGQHGEGCYDPVAASQLIAAGMAAGTPEQLASELVQRSAA
ncbi:MAG: chemotaxis protein CheB [Stenotrophomonas sp.]